MDVSRIRQFPLATFPLRIPALMRKEYEVEVSNEYAVAEIFSREPRN